MGGSKHRHYLFAAHLYPLDVEWCGFYALVMNLGGVIIKEIPFKLLIKEPKRLVGALVLLSWFLQLKNG
jgi:hypothetical protein